MIRIYGMPTCPYCDFVHEQIKGRENEFEYINIGENIRNMSAFTRLRDTTPVFDHCKEIGDVGIPAFEFEDGRISIDPADAGLIEYGTPDACSIEDHKSGKKGADMLDGEAELHIKGISIEWDKISGGSYLREKEGKQNENSIDHCRERFRRRRRNTGRYQDHDRKRGLRHERDHRAHCPEYHRRNWNNGGITGVFDPSARCGI